MNNETKLSNLLDNINAFGATKFSEFNEKEKKECINLCNNVEDIEGYIDGLMIDVMDSKMIEDHYHSGRRSTTDSVTGETVWR